MPKRVPTQTIVVQRTRDGKPTGDDKNPLMSHTPKIGDPFDFTDEEIKHIDSVNPGMLSKETKVDVSTGAPMRSLEDMSEAERHEYVARQQRGDWGTPPATTEASRQAQSEALRQTQAEAQAQAQREQAQREAADKERMAREQAQSKGGSNKPSKGSGDL